MSVDEWSVSKPKAGVIVFRFCGRLSGEGGQQSAAVLASALDREPQDIIFEVVEMTGYETAARTAWQATLFPKRKSIRSITMRGGNHLVRLGGTVLAMALGCTIKFDS
jgi:hypothetical protein